MEIQWGKYLAESRKTVIRFLAGTAIILLAAKLRMAFWITELPLKLADLRHTIIPLAAKLRVALWITQVPLKLADLRNTFLNLSFECTSVHTTARNLKSFSRPGGK